MWFVAGGSTELGNDGLVVGRDGRCEIEPVSEKSELLVVGEFEEEFGERVV